MVVLPLLWPSITAAAGMLCFVRTFDDFVTANFTASLGIRRCRCASTACFASVSRRRANAIGVIMMVIALTCVGSAF